MSHDFNPRSPCGERRQGVKRAARSLDFNPRSPCGERRQGWSALYSFNVFQSTFPLRGATHGSTHGSATNGFQSTFPLRGATTRRDKTADAEKISIHVPLAGSDKPLDPPAPPTRNFNPRSPCGERPDSHTVTASGSIFQSTFPLRGATFPVAVWRYAADISIHVPLAGSDIVHQFGFVDRLISIHAPLAGSDPRTRPSSTRTTYFNPRSPCGERPDAESTSLSTSPFQSTLPLRGATSATNLWHHACMISIHAPPAGSDCFGVSGLALFVYFNPRSPCGERRGTRAVRHRFQDFNPRSPCGERPVRECALSVVVLFQSTLPLRGATLDGSERGFLGVISIHAPLAGSDRRPPARASSPRNFNPRSPCGERRPGRSSRRPRHDFNPRSPCGERPNRHDVDYMRKAFQSTLPLRGATVAYGLRIHFLRYFNPRSPCGERLGLALTVRVLSNFNPRSPCGERRFDHALSLPSRLFQSTLPLRGATLMLSMEALILSISIHAPLAGSDAPPAWYSARPSYFNPRSPCGERLYVQHADWDDPLFQSTLPLRGATLPVSDSTRSVLISIHAPLAGSDGRVPYARHSHTISIHAPLAGSDDKCDDGAASICYFNPRSPCGERPCDSRHRRYESSISIHAPLAGSDLTHIGTGK